MLNRSNPSFSSASLSSFHAPFGRTLSALALGALLATSGCSGLFTVKQEPLAAGANASVTIPTSATTIDRVVSSNITVASVLSVTQTSVEVTAGVPGTATLTGYDASNHDLGELSVTVAATASIGHDGWIDDGVTAITGEGFDVHAITLGSDGSTLEGDGAIQFALEGSVVPYTGWGICFGDCVWFQGSTPGDAEVVMTAASSSATSTIHVHTVSALDTFTIAASTVTVTTGTPQNVSYATSTKGVAVLTNPTCTSDNLSVQAESVAGTIQVSADEAGTANVTCTEGGRTATFKVNAS